MTGGSVATESRRWDLMLSVERCFYSGPLAGEAWLGNLSAFLQAMRADDRCLIRLAALQRAPDLGDFIALSPPTPTEKLKPASWLDGYVDWAVDLPARGSRLPVATAP